MSAFPPPQPEHEPCIACPLMVRAMYDAAVLAVATYEGPAMYDTPHTHRMVDLRNQVALMKPHVEKHRREAAYDDEVLVR